MLARILFAILNGIITFVVLLIIAIVLNMVELTDIGSIINRFAWAIAVIVAALTFLGHIPSYWKNPVK